MIQYQISPTPAKHQWQITLNFIQNNHLPIEFSLPNWVPGSYLIRDFSRHIIETHAFCEGIEQPITQLSKNKWSIDSTLGQWQIYYTVYAFDLSVRGSFLNNDRGFFDGACLFLKMNHQENKPHRITFNSLPTQWQIATTLPKSDMPFTFQTASYWELIDHPVELGNIELLSFEASSITHRIALSGVYQNFDRTRFIEDIQKICQRQLEMFPSPPPFQEYLFLLHLGDNIYGGLEHISSTALLADRNSLPPLNMDTPTDAYIQLLGLMSHEYFHAWNVKSIKPKVFTPYQLDHESYTEQLWAFEGITSYYDDLFLARSKVITPETYINLLAQTITRVQQGAGRLKQSLAESSFSAWNKFYKQDENSPNAIVSYYQKGALAALCLDLLIRKRSNNQFSLDKVMQHLYQDWTIHHEGIPEKDWQQRCQAITNLDLNDFFQTALYSTHDLPLEECLESVGLSLNWQAAAYHHGGGLIDKTTTPPPFPDFGARFKQNTDSITLTHVFNDGSAENAYLCPHDKIIALNGYACTDFTKQWSQLDIGEKVIVHFFRHGVLGTTEMIVQAAKPHTAFLQITDKNLLENWLYLC